ncbi:uncharacterized protein G2W53_042314 [Senna tora]|uniref:S-adenosyl-L-methionine-dependent methyltransferase n=1 Tax=Senna tora TaxID=362788 RepID=A0A834SIW9_9FABA|nr:uncharacterized protein G2W53_042314 [Senna tora]
MSYTPFSLCPSDSDVAEALILRGFDPSHEATKFTTYKTELDLPIPQLMQIAKSAKSVLRLGVDIGGGTGTFAATMKLYNVTVVTTTMNVAAPYSEAVALRGLVPLHVPLQDVDRVLRGGGYMWVDHFFSKGADLEKTYGPLIGKLGYKKVKWATANKTDAGGLKNGEVYLTALLQKPVSR